MLASVSFPILERIPLAPEGFPLIGGLAISPHGIGIAVGFVVGAVLFIRRAQKRGVAHHYVPSISENLQTLLIRAAIGAIIGARLFFVVTHVDTYLTSVEGFLRILAVWEGGLTFLGGLTGAILLALPEMRKRGYSPLMLLDSAAPGIAAGLVLGRTGDLIIGDHIGLPAGDFPLGWSCTANYWDRAGNWFARIVPERYPLDAVTSGAIEPPTQGCFDIALHQTALYDFLSAGSLLLLMLLLERRRRFDGFFVVLYVYWYGLFRFLTDFARQDRTWSGLTGSQWAILAAAVAVTTFLITRAPWKRGPYAWDPPHFDHPWKQPPADAATPGPEDAGATDGGLDTADGGATRPPH
ncbi:MAG TPA: prolipoprotein diacylglyceryl transferase family protein [Nitriliruptorales bacterium]